MVHGFERKCIVHETVTIMVHFFIYANMYILLYKCTYTYYTFFYVRGWNMTRRDVKKTKLKNKTLG